MKWQPPKRFDYRVWHRWFAWYPVELEDGRWVWLERIERKYDGLTIDYCTVWLYRVTP